LFYPRQRAPAGRSLARQHPAALPALRHHLGARTERGRADDGGSSTASRRRRSKRICWIRPAAGDFPRQSCTLGILSDQAGRP
jgi:hypothetical protein